MTRKEVPWWSLPCSQAPNHLARASCDSWEKTAVGGSATLGFTSLVSSWSLEGTINEFCYRIRAIALPMASVLRFGPRTSEPGINRLPENVHLFNKDASSAGPIQSDA